MTRLLVLDHVHWDREWYRPHEQFRTRLVELVDTVLDELERGDRTVFHLDGQTITVADVLAVRPDLEVRLSALVRAGRLTVGPWHVLADNQLVSGECLVRNLLLGRRWGQRLGGLTQDGYSPDAFGHPADLPRVLAGFGISTALVWRGAPPEHARFRWRSPDGSEVLAVHQRYHEAEVLWQPDLAGQALREFVEGEADRCPEGPWLLMNGGDHLLPRRVEDRADALRDAGVTAVPVSLPTLFEEVRRSTAARELPVVEGELRRLGGRLSFLLPGTLSARTYLKTANARAQTLLTDWAEPLAVLVPSREGPALLAHAWDLMVQNAPHDSVCGCSVDAVHEQNVLRAARVQQVGEDLRARALQRQGLETRRLAAAPDEVAHVAVANPHARAVTRGVQVELLTDPARWPVAVHDGQGAAVPFDVEDLGVEKSFEADLDRMPDTVDVRRHRLALVARDVPARGHEVYRVMLAERGATPPEWQPGRSVECDDVLLVAADDASVTVTDAGLTLPGAGRLVDGGDRGDSYTWDPPAADVPVTPQLRAAQVRRGRARSQLRLHAELALPAALDADRSGRSTQVVPVPVQVTVTAWRGVPGLTWDVQLDNSVSDHRLRFHLPAAVPASSWTGDGLFSLVDRPTGPALGDLPPRPGFEAEVGVAPVQTLAAVGEGSRRVALLCAGLPEVQGLDTAPGEPPELAVTLLRGVGWLSRFDLATRTAGAGPQLATPGAQCLGPQAFRLGVVWGAAVADDLDLVAAAAEHRSGLFAVQVHQPSAEPAVPPVLAVEGACVTAWKPAEDGDGSVLRLSNPTARPRRAVVTGSALQAVTSLEVSELDERRAPASPVPAARVELDLPPYALRTLRLLP